MVRIKGSLMNENAARILEYAANDFESDIITWTKGTFFNQSHHSYCALGALQRARKKLGLGLSSLEDAKLELARKIAYDPSEIRRGLINRVIIGFNDHTLDSGLSAKEVLTDLLKETAKDIRNNG